MANRNISPERRTTYYLGMILTGIGVVLFFSTFVSGCSNFGNFSNFNSRAQSEMGMAIAGMVCIAAGQGLMKLGRSGTAGSGLKLDPEQARRDLEPWNRMAGGMLRDTLDEAGINLNRSKPEGSELPFDEQLRRLEALKRDNLVSGAEYDDARRRILERIGA